MFCIVTGTSDKMDNEETLVADVNDESCVTRLVEIVPLDRETDGHHTAEFVTPAAEVKPEDLQDVKQETADENDTEDSHCSVKQEPADEDDTEDPCFSIKVKCLCFCGCKQLFYLISFSGVMKIVSKTVLTYSHTHFIYTISLNAIMTRRMAIANGTCVSFCNQPKAQFGFPCVHPWDNRSKCHMDEKMIVKCIAACTHLSPTVSQ